MRCVAEVVVALRPGVLDAQGETVRGALLALGYGGVGRVRVGKHITLELEAESEADAGLQVDEMCRRLLANPVLEDYRVRVIPAPAAGGEAGGGRAAEVSRA